MADSKRRIPVIAFFLSLVAPGLGQVYNGQLKKGLLFYLLGYCLVALLLTSFRSVSEFSGLIFFSAALLALIAYLLFTPLEALFRAIRLREITLKPYNKWYVYLIIFAVTHFLVDSLIIPPPLLDIRKEVKAYKLSSSSMQPTLYVGDHLMTNINIYKGQKPRRGDVIVFEYPGDPPKDFMKRVIGLENEKIEMTEDKIYVNDELMCDPWGNYEDNKLTRSIPALQNFGPVVVPAGSVFVLGDNRNNSQDSRHFGFVDLSKIKAKVLYIYWAKQKSRIGMEVNKGGPRGQGPRGQVSTFNKGPGDGVRPQHATRKICIYLSYRRSGLNLREIGGYFGMQRSAIGRLSRRFGKTIKGDQKLRKVLDNIERRGAC